MNSVSTLISDHFLISASKEVAAYNRLGALDLQSLIAAAARIFDLARSRSLCVSTSALPTRHFRDFGQHRIELRSFITAAEKLRELQMAGFWEGEGILFAVFLETEKPEPTIVLN